MFLIFTIQSDFKMLMSRGTSFVGGFLRLLEDSNEQEKENQLFVKNF